MKKEEADKIYTELSKEYTDEEIAESCVFSVDMTEDEREELRTSIDERRRRMTDEERQEVVNFLKKENACRIR